MIITCEMENVRLKKMMVFLLLTLIFTTGSFSKIIPWPFPASFGEGGLIQIMPWENMSNNALFLAVAYVQNVFTCVVTEVSFTPEPQMLWYLNVTNILLSLNFRYVDQFYLKDALSYFFFSSKNPM